MTACSRKGEVAGLLRQFTVQNQDRVAAIAVATTPRFPTSRASLGKRPALTFATNSSTGAALQPFLPGTPRQRWSFANSAGR